MRNKLFMHTIKDENVLGGLKFVSKHEDSQKSHSQERAKKRTKTATTPKKKSSLTGDDNIISEDPDAALELAKSIEKAGKCCLQRYSNSIKEETTGQSHKLEGVQVMSIEERLVADTKKAIKANKLAIGP
ncbi:hypothetical protein Tco_0047029 [Tanacetum coccineum]